MKNSQPLALIRAGNSAGAAQQRNLFLQKSLWSVLVFFGRVDDTIVNAHRVRCVIRGKHEASRITGNLGGRTL